MNAAGALPLALVAGLAPATPADVPTPPMEARSPLPLVWQGVGRVSVLCLVVTDRGVDSGPLHQRLCAAVATAARAGAPVPVEIVGVGDASLLAAETVTLLVHARVQQVADAPVMAFSIRPFRNRVDDAGVLFGAAPRSVSLADGAAVNTDLESAVRAALLETLPWQRQRDGARLLKR